ncbi:MAG TPA: hypothetical protein VM010_07130 [Chitinophagaceae bacterium]|nr:hypothetical protein [Chitinophagaceae bacterium]
MKRIFPALLILLAFSVLISCHKEKSFEVAAPAVGSLKSDNNGDCLPKTAVGAFVAGTALTDSNYLEVDIDVASEGSYAIRTDTLNGYSFSGIGNFTQTGINRIRLAGSGTPLTNGTNQFAVIYDTSLCYVDVVVLEAGSSASPSEFTLQGSGDSCMVSAVAGNYIQNQPLDGSNSVVIKVNATKPGTYTVTTNTVNDFKFAGSGTLSAVGEQTITLFGSGTPTTEGSTVFTVTAGGTTCTFSVNVNTSTTPPVTTGDLFPLTQNSWWSYLLDLNTPTDSTTATVLGAVPISGQTYQKVQLRNAAEEPYDSAFYRKSGSDYFRYLAFDSSSIPGLDNPVAGDVLFLHDNPRVGDTWNTEADVKINGADRKLRVNYQCMAANVTRTVNGVTYTNVYQVNGTIEAGSGGVFSSVGASEEAYYARGIGLIDQKITGGPFGDFQRQLKNYSIK